MNRIIQLRGTTWDHTRGYTSAVATAQRFHELNPDIDVHWSKRSLQAFADHPISELAENYDLLIIDHPWAGFAAASGVLLPLEDYLPAEFLEDQAANSVGQSHTSYRFNDRQWALAIDAACPVSVSRIDLLDRAGVAPPRTFDELIRLGKQGLVCCPSIPIDVYGNFLNLCTAAGESLFANPDAMVSCEGGLAALDRLKQLADVVPDRFFDLNPIKTLEVMSHSDEFGYAPYTYGYANYSRRGYASNLLTFGDVIGINPESPGATMLGGTGLAISSRCKHPEIAAQYAQFVASPEIQHGLFVQSGGQPGHRSAWVDDTVNYHCMDYFWNTLPTLDRAFVRPRYHGYLEFQDQAGDVIHNFLRKGGNLTKTIDQINALYRQSQLVAVK